MANDLFAASEGLSVIIRHLAHFEHGGLVLDGDGVAELSLQLKAIRRLVQRLEHEVSRRRWNDGARRDRKIEGLADAILVASHIAAGGNVVAFPNRMPAFSDGRGEEWR
jgi:predicted phosphoribosyltransferase